MFSCEIKTKKLEYKLNNIVKEFPRTINDSLDKVLKNIRGESIKLEKSHNSNGILVEIVENSTGKVKGKVYARADEFMANEDTSYLLFEYFGTGQFAEMNHVGKTKHFIETGYTEWYIPVNKVNKPLNYPIKNIYGNNFYVADGAEPNHFLTDAEFKTRGENLEIVKSEIITMFKKVCK